MLKVERITENLARLIKKLKKKSFQNNFRASFVYILKKNKKKTIFVILNHA